MSTAAPTHADTSWQVTSPTIASVTPVVRPLSTKQHAARIFELPLECMHNKEFDQPQAEQTILTSTSNLGTTLNSHSPPSGLPSYLAALYETPLLSRDQERQLFRKYNYLKYTAELLRRQLDLARPKVSLMHRIERLYNDAIEAKNQIIRANLRLVVSLAKKRTISADHFFSLISDGNMSLFRAVEKFDYSLGNKFSSYATGSIIRNFAGTIHKNFQHQARFPTGHDEVLAAKPDLRGNHITAEAQQSVRAGHVSRILRYLDEREQLIITRRFGLESGKEPKTLEEVGVELGVSRELIRRIQARAMNKLRGAARHEGIQLLT